MSYIIREGQEREKGRYLVNDVRLGYDGRCGYEPRVLPQWSQYQRDALPFVPRWLALQHASWVGGRVVKAKWDTGGGVVT